MLEEELEREGVWRAVPTLASALAKAADTINRLIVFAGEFVRDPHHDTHPGDDDTGSNIKIDFGFPSKVEIEIM